MQSKNSWSNWVFLFQWTSMNLLGTITGVVFVVLMYALLLSDASESVTAVFDRGISIVILGLLLGLFQWLVLRSKMEQIGSWIPATAIGLVIGVTGLALIRYILVPDDPSPLNPTLVAGVNGTLLGTAQWIVLRKHIRRSLPWILGSAAGWSLGATTLVAVQISSFIANNIFQELLLGTLVMFIAIGIYSIITGCIFIWLLKVQEHVGIVGADAEYS